MNGAESLMRTAAAAGIEVCFANPGTTEMPLVAALDAVPEVRAVLGLFEGVCTGAADGYARMARKPALTLLHLGPGFANGIANLHNARRAHSPLVNLIGDHATWHLAHDAPLTSDIASLAAPVSGWLRRATSATQLGRDLADACAAACEPPGQVATLIVPHDCQWEDARGPARPRTVPVPASVDGAIVDGVAEQLRSDGATALLLGGGALGERGLRAAGQIAAVSGCALFCETFPALLARGAGLPPVARLPYFPEQASEALARFETLVLAGARDPVSFFATRGAPSRLAPESCRVVTLADARSHAVGALEALSDALGASRREFPVAPRLEPARPTGPLDPVAAGAILASLLPEGAIVVDEAVTSGLPFFLKSEVALPFSYLSLTGGAIGQGLPCATGAAIACPGRKVIAFQADGSGLYSLQALWTQSREGLDVITLICANRSYRILQIELARAGIAEPGPQARALTDLSHPEIDWCALSQGLGVPASRAERAEDLQAALETALAEPGPRLIELRI